MSEDLNAPTIDETRQRLAREYGRTQRRLWLAELALSAVALVGVSASGAAVWLREVVAGLTSFPLLQVALFLLIGSAGYGATTWRTGMDWRRRARLAGWAIG
ncbi:MAG: hypothetical protein HY329_18095 [Chloroflexi bacterium]|nr:hypothetical protein [Chloroflexota bacterium]